jgi:hypothetical protein
MASTEAAAIPPASPEPAAVVPPVGQPDLVGQSSIGRGGSNRPPRAAAAKILTPRPWAAASAVTELGLVRARPVPLARPVRDARQPPIEERPGGRMRAWWPLAFLAVAAIVVGLIVLVPGFPPATPGAQIAPRAGAAAPTPQPSRAVPGSSTPKVVAAASEEPTEPPDDRTLPPTGAGQPGRLEMATQRLAVWEDRFGAVRAEVVVTVRNTGGSPIGVALSTATWTVTDHAGDSVASGRFAHAFPPIVEPGGEAFLIDGVSAAFAEADELAKLEVEVQGEPVGDEDGLVALDVADVHWTSDDDGVVISGRVENPSANAVREAYAAVVLRNDRDEILAAVYDVAIGPLGPGESRPFDTAYPGTPPVDPDEVAIADAVASGKRGTGSNAE